jgi:excisionase family DNA binding protein
MMDLRHFRELIDSTPAGELPALIGEIEGLKAAAWHRLTAPAPMALPAAADGAGVTADELARVFAVPKSFFYELARCKRIPCIRLGRYVRFNRADVERALAEDSKIARLGSRKKRRSNGDLQQPATALLPRETIEERETP